MLNIFKKQKIDLKALEVNTASALTQFGDNSTADTLLNELGINRGDLIKVTALDEEFESCREDIRTAMLAKSWRIWGDDADEEMINRLYKMMRPHLKTLAEVAINARLGGYAVAEYIYRREADGLWVIDQVSNKGAELDSYDPKAGGELVYNAGGEEIALNREVKFLLLTSRADASNPKGDALAVRAYPAVQLRKKGLPYAMQFIQRYAQPYVVIKHGGFGASLGEVANKVFAFVSGGAIAIGKDDELAIHKLDSDGQAFVRIERLANMRIQKLLLGRVKTSELENGSRSAQETDDETRDNRMRGYLDLLEEAAQHAINAVLAVNRAFGRDIAAPQSLWFEFDKPADISVERAERDAKYLATGQVRLTKDYYTSILGYEDAHIEIMEQPPTTPVPLALSLPAPFTQDAQTLAHDRRIMSAKMDALLAALAEADSYTDFEAALGDLTLPDGGMTADLADKLAAAHAAGKAGAETWPE